MTIKIKTSIEITLEGYCQEGDNISKFARKKWVDTEDMIKELDKLDQQLQGYACGYHKQLHKQIKNIKKKL